MKAIYRIEWTDPTVHSVEELKKPFKKFMTKTVSYGEIKTDGNYIAIISTPKTAKDITDDQTADFTIIHKSLLISKKKLKE